MDHLIPAALAVTYLKLGVWFWWSIVVAAWTRDAQEGCEFSRFKVACVHFGHHSVLIQQTLFVLSYPLLLAAGWLMSRD